MTWFLVLIVSAALLAPVGILLGRLTVAICGRWIGRVGVVAPPSRFWASPVGSR